MKKILLGISGGIAAYKSAELTRLLRKNDYQVRVVMTHAATQFVTPLTFQALSGNPVHTQLLDVSDDINLITDHTGGYLGSGVSFVDFNTDGFDDFLVGTKHQ